MKQSKIRRIFGLIGVLLLAGVLLFSLLFPFLFSKGRIESRITAMADDSYIKIEPGTAFTFNDELDFADHSSEFTASFRFIGSTAYTQYVTCTEIGVRPRTRDMWFYVFQPSSNTLVYQADKERKWSLNLIEKSCNVIYFLVDTSIPRDFYDWMIKNGTFSYIGSGTYNEGYDDGYVDGMNKGQSDSLTNPVSFFLQPIQTFLDNKLFGNFSIGMVLNVVLFVGLALIFIKMFAGG